MKFLLYIFKIWWRPVLLLLIFIAVTIVGELCNSHIVANIGLGFSMLSLVLLGLSAIIHLVQRKWFEGIASFLIVGVVVAGILSYATFLYFMEQVDGDKWADNLKIPAGIELNLPKGDLYGMTGDIDTVKPYFPDHMDFEIYNGMQPGIYTYKFWCKNLEPGTIYLKAFEITQEYALSTHRLPDRSSVAVFNNTDSMRQFSCKGDFTIYEGDWGKPYAARFEIWFRPDEKGKERKLMAKNYKIEGWMR